MSLNDELVKLKIGTPAPKRLDEVVVEMSWKFAPVGQVEFIDMKRGDQWNPGKIQRVTADSEILFHVVSVISSAEFVVSYFTFVNGQPLVRLTGGAAPWVSASKGVALISHDSRYNL